MKKLLSILLLLWFATTAFAQSTCPAPEQSIAIFFGNGITTTPDSAELSLERLEEEIGDSYKGQKVRYDLAYNKTTNIYVDLGQSAVQAGIQFDSQIMLWLNGQSLAPDWFAQWYQKFLLGFTVVAADELPEHIGKYGDAIAFGQKVVVVAHSQGNFYANEARKLLHQKLSAEKMASFQIFGVAVPANNVGGATGPYLTNDRDFIYSAVPGAISSNWVLRRADGTSAQDVSRITAHFFNGTYISPDFDTRPVLLLGIKAQMDAAQKPQADCSTYRPQILSMVKGNYNQTCNNPGAARRSTVITESGVTVAYPTVVSADMSGPDTAVNLSNRPKETKPGSLKTILINGASWNSDGNIETGCGVGKDEPGGNLGRPVNITKTMLGVIDGVHQLFPRNRCAVGDKNGSQDLKVPTAVVISGTTVYAGDMSWELTSDISSELVEATRGAGTAPADYDPGFVLINMVEGGRTLLLEYRRNKGLRSVSLIEYSPNLVIHLSCQMPQ